MEDVQEDAILDAQVHAVELVQDAVVAVLVLAQVVQEHVQVQIQNNKGGINDEYGFFKINGIIKRSKCY